MPLPFALGLLGLGAGGQYLYDKYNDWRSSVDAEKLKGLLGTQAQPYQMSEAEMFPGEQPIQGLQTQGTGLLGGEITPAQFYGGLLDIPRYQEAGVKGIMNMMTPGQAESPFAKIDPSKFTPESVRQFAATGDYGALQPIPGAESSPFAKIDPAKFTPESMRQFVATGDPSVLRAAADPTQARAEQDSRFNRSNTLRDEFMNVTKGFSEVNDAYGRIMASVSNPSPSGDIALVFNFMKMLDPGSTVREGEAATIQNAGGISDTIRNMYNKLLTGEILQPGQRADFLNRASLLYKEALGGYNQKASEYRRLSEQFGVNPADVIINRQTYDPNKSLLSPQESQELEAYRKKYGR